MGWSQQHSGQQIAKFMESSIATIPKAIAAQLNNSASMSSPQDVRQNNELGESQLGRRKTNVSQVCKISDLRFSGEIKHYTLIISICKALLSHYERE